MEEAVGEHPRLLELVRHIKDTGLKDRLFGSLSMDKLVLSIYDPVDYGKEALHITFDRLAKKWHFVYFALPFQEADFIRIYDENEGMDKLDNFIERIRW